MASGGSNFVQNLTSISMDFTFLDAPTRSTDETLPTDFRIFRHGFLIIKHVCRHGILAPVMTRMEINAKHCQVNANQNGSSSTLSSRDFLGGLALYPVGLSDCLFMPTGLIDVLQTQMCCVCYRFILVCHVF